ncbi:hypothetical protein CIB48_g2394 [Xylaria polymorpha]|nr:hypothetical protein CIB48_g2394 [Xylaria polymorpha]
MASPDKTMTPKPNTMKIKRPVTPLPYQPTIMRANRGASSTTSETVQNPLRRLRRLLSTTRGRVAVATVVAVEIAIEYEFWKRYGSKYFGKGEE